MNRDRLLRKLLMQREVYRFAVMDLPRVIAVQDNQRRAKRIMVPLLERYKRLLAIANSLLETVDKENVTC